MKKSAISPLSVIFYLDQRLIIALDELVRYSHRRRATTARFRPEM
jgi:hypothetical protein